MAKNNALLGDLMANFDTCALGENYSVADVVAVHISRAIDLITNSMDGMPAIGIAALSARELTDFARSLLDQREA